MQVHLHSSAGASSLDVLLEHPASEHNSQFVTKALPPNVMDLLFLTNEISDPLPQTVFEQATDKQNVGGQQKEASSRWTPSWTNEKACKDFTTEAEITGMLLGATVLDPKTQPGLRQCFTPPPGLNSFGEAALLYSQRLSDASAMVAVQSDILDETPVEVRRLVSGNILKGKGVAGRAESLQHRHFGQEDLEGELLQDPEGTRRTISIRDILRHKPSPADTSPGLGIKVVPRPPEKVPWPAVSQDGAGGKSKKPFSDGGFPSSPNSIQLEERLLSFLLSRDWKTPPAGRDSLSSGASSSSPVAIHSEPTPKLQARLLDILRREGRDTDVESSIGDSEDDSASEDGESADVIVGPTELAVQPMKLKDVSLPMQTGLSNNSVLKKPISSSPRCLSISDCLRLANVRPFEAPLSFGSALHLSCGPGHQCRPCMFERWAGRCNKSWLCDFCHLHTVQKARRDGNGPRAQARAKVAQHIKL
mmetsp:Transcript_81709/g.239875  ORF Transcript_81709/g.239875 Transcript_81709/m.239875 type:complete len:476 (+) Transcript_81709:132-1559(+)